MTRQTYERVEFSASVKDAAHARSGGVCENKRCRLPLQIGKIHYDHILPCALGGKAVLSNCQVLCEPCHREKTSREDVPRIRKADRVRRKYIGATAPKRPIRSRGFPKVEKARHPKPPPLPRRALFVGVRSTNQSQQGEAK